MGNFVTPRVNFVDNYYAYPRFISGNRWVAVILGTRQQDGTINEKYTFVPGEEIGFSWEIFDYSNGRRIHPDAQLSILFEGNIIRQASEVRSGVINIRDIGHELAQRFFEINRDGGSRTLDYLVTLAGEQDPVSDSDLIQIVPDTPDQADPPSQNIAFVQIIRNSPNRFRWKNDAYSISASVLNLSRFASLTLTPLLREVVRTTGNSVGPHDNTAPQGSATVTLLPGAMAELSWPQLSQNWSWFDQGTLSAPASDLSRVFAYTVSCAVADEFGNNYAVLTSGSELITVFIEDGKINNLMAAAYAQDTAIVTGILSLIVLVQPEVAGVIAGVAGTAEAIARGFAAGAVDPPQPDPLFDKLATAEPSSIEASVVALMKNTSQFLTAASTVANAQRAFEITHSRVLGAIAKKDMDWASRQIAQYADNVQRAVRAAESMGAMTPAVVAELTSFKSDDKRLSEVYKELLKSGFPKDRQEILIKNGVSNVEIKYLSQAIASAIRKQELPSEMPALIEKVRRSVHGLAAACQELARQNQLNAASVFRLRPAVQK